MTEAFITYVCLVAAVVFVVAVFIPRLGHRSLQSGEVPVLRSGGSIVNNIARWVVLSLGRITFGALYLFKKLGVNVANIDETLASWTAWSENIKTQLAAALADAQNLRDTDAAEDAAQANALSEALAQKVEAAYNAATSSPATQDPAPDQPGPPVTPPSSDVPVEDVPVVTPEDIDAQDQSGQ